MPNWVTNELRVAGAPDDVARFTAEVRPLIETKQGMCALFPLPAAASKEIVWANPDGTETRFTAFAKESDGGIDGYTAALDAWGTKWGDCETVIGHEHDNEVVIKYETAWSPASRLIARLSERHPNLVFGTAFVEEGNGFIGFEVVVAGETVAEGSGESPDVVAMGIDTDTDEGWERLLDAQTDAWDSIRQACDDEVSARLGEMSR